MSRDQSLPAHVIGATSYVLFPTAKNISQEGSKRALRWETILRYSSVYNGISLATQEGGVTKRHLHMLERAGHLIFDTSPSHRASGSADESQSRIESPFRSKKLASSNTATDSSLRTSRHLQTGSVYTRDDLRSLFLITDATINTGIFRPQNSDSIWLFVTEEQTNDRTPYQNRLKDDVLLMQGQTEGRTDSFILDEATNKLELLVFHRKDRFEHAGAGFRYLGQFNYIRSFGSRPKSFVLSKTEAREYKYGKQSWRWVLEAVQQLGGEASSSQIAAYITHRVPSFNVGNVEPDLHMLTVNERKRSLSPHNRAPRRTDGFHPVDALFKVDTEEGPRYRLYEPVRHGVWELLADANGVMRPQQVAETVELADAQQDLLESGGFDANDEHDARHWQMASIARRQGQSQFRYALMHAYGAQCAVTGCTILEILEAAHIKPYLGKQTNHVTNGLLLRADIHTLLDLGMLRIEPTTLRIEVSASAKSGYGSYDGSLLRPPIESAHRPDIEALRHHYERSASRFRVS